MVRVLSKRGPERKSALRCKRKGEYPAGSHGRRQYCVLRGKGYCAWRGNVHVVNRTRLLTLVNRHGIFAVLVLIRISPTAPPTDMVSTAVNRISYSRYHTLDTIQPGPSLYAAITPNINVAQTRELVDSKSEVETKSAMPYRSDLI